MLTISSLDIKRNQNTEDNIKLQCAAGYYYNLAEKMNYICWALCIVAIVVSFISDSDSLVGMSLMLIIDICCIAAAGIVNSSTKSAGDLRKLFDARVLFGDNGGFENTEIRELNEKAIRIISRHKKNYDYISCKNGSDTPPGKRDWYDLSDEIEPLKAQLECQAQNRWWNKEMVKIRQVVLGIVFFIVVVIVAVLYAKLHISTVAMGNAMTVVFARMCERAVCSKKYYKVSVNIDTQYKTASENVSEKTIKDLQKYIDERRHLPVFEMNIIHRLRAAKLTKLYREICKG